MNRSFVLAFSLAAALVLWMLIGLVAQEVSLESVSEDQNKPAPKMTVKVQDVVAEAVSKEIIFQGKLEPFRQVEVKAEISAKVTEILAVKGRRVAQDDTLVKLAVNDRLSRVDQVKAQLEHLKLEVKAAQQLLDKGLNSQNRLRSAEANLARAQAEYKTASLALKNTTIYAPFSGVWELQHVEKGSHLDVGQSVGLLVDNSQLKAVGNVSQQAVGDLTLGQSVVIRLLDGREALGTLTYIAKLGDQQTQSFRIEALVENADYALHAGASAEIRIQTGEQLAHFVSPSSLSLGDQGEVGIKGINQNNEVVFYPITLVRKDLNGVWVSGLPEVFTVITLGQGFVNHGDTVISVRT